MKALFLILVWILMNSGTRAYAALNVAQGSYGDKPSGQKSSQSAPLASPPISAASSTAAVQTLRNAAATSANPAATVFSNAKIMASPASNVISVKSSAVSEPGSIFSVPRQGDIPQQKPNVLAQASPTTHIRQSANVLPAHGTPVLQSQPVQTKTAHTAQDPISRSPTTVLQTSPAARFRIPPALPNVSQIAISAPVRPVTIQGNVLPASFIPNGLQAPFQDNASPAVFPASFSTHVPMEASPHRTSPATAKGHVLPATVSAQLPNASPGTPVQTWKLPAAVLLFSPPPRSNNMTSALAPVSVAPVSTLTLPVQDRTLPVQSSVVQGRNLPAQAPLAEAVGPSTQPKTLIAPPAPTFRRASTHRTPIATEDRNLPVAALVSYAPNLPVSVQQGRKFPVPAPLAEIPVFAVRESKPPEVLRIPPAPTFRRASTPRTGIPAQNHNLAQPVPVQQGRSFPVAALHVSQGQNVSMPTPPILPQVQARSESVPAKPGLVPSTSIIGRPVSTAAIGPARGRAIKATKVLPASHASQYPVLGRRMPPRVIQPPVKSPLQPAPEIPDDCVPGPGTSLGRSLEKPGSGSKSSGTGSKPNPSEASGFNAAAVTGSKSTGSSSSHTGTGSGSASSAGSSAASKATGTGSSGTAAGTGSSSSAASGSGSKPPGGSPTSSGSGSKPPGGSPTSSGSGSKPPGGSSAASSSGSGSGAGSSSATAGTHVSPPLPGSFDFCGLDRVFNVDECSATISQKYGGDFCEIRAFHPQPPDKFGSGLHFQITLKSGRFGGKKGFQNLALQVMANGVASTRTEILGEFLPFTNNFNEGNCSLGAYSPYHTDTVSLSESLYECPTPLGDGAVKPSSVALEFGKHDVQEYHIRWRFSSDSSGDVWDTAQLQLFTVPPGESCQIHTTATVDIAKVTPGPAVTGYSFDCHMVPATVTAETEAYVLDWESAAYLSEFKKTLCLEQNQIEECTTKMGVSISIAAHFPAPNLNGWVFLEITGIVASGQQGPWYVQVVSVDGQVHGSWMSAEALECTDLVSAMDLHLPSSGRMDQFITPYIDTLTTTEVIIPHVLGLTVDPSVKPRQTRTVIVFRYSTLEAQEIAEGFQVQIFGSITQKSSKDLCFAKFISAVFTADSPGVYWDKVAKLPFPDKCLGPKLNLAPAPVVQGPIMLTHEFEQACKAMPLETETDKSRLPTMPHLMLKESPKGPQASEFAVNPGESPAEKEKLLRSQKHNQAKPVKDWSKDDFYVKCEELLKGCVGDRKDCVKSRNCQTIVTYRKLEDKSEIEIYGQAPKYISFGISKDRKMGNDSVVECVREDGGLRIYRSFNTKNFMNKRLRNHSSINILQGFYKNGWLYCKFQLDRITTVQSMTFDLVEEEYYILMARGDEAEDSILGGLGFHGPRRHASEAKHKLMLRFGETPLYKWNKLWHGVSMIVAWIFLVPTATFAVRYFKETYDGKYMCGMRIWFGLHVVILGVVVGLTLLAFVSAGLMTKFKFGKSVRGWYFHNIAGFTLLGLMILQVMLGIGIFKNTRAELGFINKLHGVLGHAQFFLAFAIIYKSKDIRGGIDCNDPAVLITWIVIYFLIHIFMSYQVCYVDYVQGADVSRVYALPALAPARITEAEPNAPGGVVRKVFFGILIFCALVTTALLLKNYLGGGRDCVEAALYDSDRKVVKETKVKDEEVQGDYEEPGI